MKKIDLGQTVTVLANLGVLAGIILVAYEINQANVTTRAEMVSNHQDRWVAMDLSWQTQNFAAAWANAMDNPEELTLTEMIQLNGFMWSYVDHITTNRILWDLGVFREPQQSFEDVIVGNTALFFGNEFTQAWWAENRVQIDSRTVELIDREIAKVSPGQNLDVYTRIRTRVNE